MFPKSLLVSILLFHLATISVKAGIDEADAKDEHGEVLFRVYDENKIKLFNLHREKKPLKFSIHGTSVERLEKKSSTRWTMSLEDKSLVELTVETTGSVTKYYLNWINWIAPNANREICFHYGYDHASWFNAYQGATNASWPMNVSKTTDRQQFNFLFDLLRYYSRYTDHEHVLVLEQLFYNSHGYAILLDQYAPWFIRRNPNGNEPVMCFSVSKEAPYMTKNSGPGYLDINIHFFASNNIKTVSDYVINHSGYIPKPKAIPDERMFYSPTWFTFAMDLRENGMTLANEIEANQLSTDCQIILIDAWDAADFDKIANKNTYPKESEIVNVQNRGFKIGIQFYGPNLQKHQSTEKFCAKPTDFVDFSNVEACDYFLTKMNNLHYEKQISIFYASAGKTLPVEFEVLNGTFRAYPSMLTTKYIETISRVTKSIVISDYGYKTQHLPVWVRSTCFFYPSKFSQWLDKMIPNALSLSMAGYAFIIPFSAGGFHPGERPSEEIFIRMIQAITFMPSMSFSKKLWDYNANVIAIAKKYIQLHAEHAPTIIELAKKRVTEGSPIIRPMWYAAPEDERAFKIGDQYMLGDDIVVAPVVVEGKRERMVYLPPGTWTDQHGKSYTGPGELKVQAPLEELPYFKRKL